jgi:predicted GIY-YIG superfamily endonuclease
MREYHFFVYIMASKSRTLYIGFTSRLGIRVSQHKNGTFEGFSKDYQCHRLAYYEHFKWGRISDRAGETAKALVKGEEDIFDRKGQPDLGRFERGVGKAN